MLNEKFSVKYGDEWLNHFSSINKKDIWRSFYPYGKPALGTFYSHVREHDSLNDFLLYWLVVNKQKAMEILGYSKSEIKTEISKFTDCGRYLVTYGKGEAFGTY